MASSIFANRSPRAGSKRCLLRIWVACLVALLAFGSGGSAAFANTNQRSVPARTLNSVDATGKPTLEERKAMHVLSRALLSPASTFYSGEQTVLTFNQGDGAACVTRETHLGPDRYRIEFQNPPDARGRIQIADHGWRRLYLPQAHSVVKRPVISTRLTRAAARRRVEQVRQQYHLLLEPELDDVDGRRAYVLSISPRHPDRPSQKLWIDRVYGLILRREVYNTEGIQTSVTFWRDLRFYRTPPVSALSWKPSKGIQVVVDRTEEETDRLDRARALASAWAVVPAELHGGFLFTNAHRVDALGTKGLYCEYSDGLNTLSLVQLAETRTISEDNSVQPHVSQIGDHNAQVSVRGPITVLSWQNHRPAVTLSLIGEITQSALLSIARTLR